MTTRIWLYRSTELEELMQISEQQLHFRVAEDTYAAVHLGHRVNIQASQRILRKLSSEFTRLVQSEAFKEYKDQQLYFEVENGTWHLLAEDEIFTRAHSALGNTPSKAISGEAYAAWINSKKLTKRGETYSMPGINPLEALAKASPIFEARSWLIPKSL
jgi:hypothetical protein